MNYRKSVLAFIGLFLIPAITAIFLTSWSPPATAASQDIIKIGHIRPLTGNLAITSSLMVKAFDLAFQQVNYQVAGKQIQIIVGDTKGDPASAIDLARKMVENDKVAMVVGATTVGENMALAGYFNRVGVPQILSVQMPVLQIPNNKWVIGAGGTPAQLTSIMGAYAYDKLNYRKVGILTQDNSSGRAFLNPFMASFKAKGGQIVQETYTTFPAPDFAPYLTVLKEADALVAWTAGADAIKFLTQYHEMGFDKRLPLLGAYHGSFLVPYVLNNMSPAAAAATVGCLLPTPYSPALNTEANKKFVAEVQSKMNIYPDDTESGPYQVGMAVIEALKATSGDTTPERLRQAFLNVNFVGPEGPTKFDPQTGISIKTLYICKIVKQGNHYTWQDVFTYPDVPPTGLR
jgi:branched-chain amino acid transport system substrate-binding protein